MKYKVLGIINCFPSPELGDLTQFRSLASTSFLGRYSYIDFPLSNYLNSNISSIEILCKKHLKSLYTHIGNGRQWLKNTKTGSCSILYDEPNSNSEGYNTDINCILENSSDIDLIHPDFVVFCSPHMVYEYNYNELLEKHIQSGNRISILYGKVKKGLKNGFVGQKKVNIEDGCLKSIENNLGDSDSGNLYLHTIMMDYPMLLSLLEYAQSTSSFFSLDDLITYLLTSSPNIKISAVELNSYFLCMDSLSSHLNNSLKLLNPSDFNALFKDDWPIKTCSYDTAPTKYKDNAQVSNCYVSNGCTIDGIVENSIIGRNVVIEKNAHIKNSIIFSGTHIESGVNLSYVVSDKNAVIKHKKNIIGTPDNPIYIKRGDEI